MRCPGGYSEGSEVVLGRYWYKCHNGELEEKGCIDEQGHRVDLYSTTNSISQAYQFQCTLDSRGLLTFEYKACLYNGRSFGVNERWSDDKYVYICLKEADHLRQDVDGCVDNGHEVGINEKVQRNGFLYQCKQNNNGTCSMCPIGCVKADHEYLIGETFDDGHFWYNCSKTNDGRIVLKPNGCLNAGQRLKDGDRFVQGDIAYQCQLNKNDYEQKVVGCMSRDQQGNNVDRRLDETWTEGVFDYACKYDQTTETASKVPVRCNFNTGVTTLNIASGCYRIQDGTIYACVKDPNTNRLRIKPYGSDQIGAATADGLKYC